MDKKVKGFKTYACKKCGNVLRGANELETGCAVCKTKDWRDAILDER